MKQYTYIKQFKVLTSDSSLECSAKIKKTGYKKLKAFDSKHQATELIVKKMDDDALWLECKTKEALICEAKRLKNKKRRSAKKAVVRR